MKTVKECKVVIEAQEARIAELEKVVLNLIESNDMIIATITAKPATSSTRKERDYGPKSQNKMTNHSAWRILFGDLKAMKVKDIADELGLSRGQVYSVTGNYTFTGVKESDYALNLIG